MLDIRNLSIRYQGATAVDNLDLTLGEQEILTLVGPTGCGKTSVLRAVAGLIQPSAGEIRIGDLVIDAKRVVPPEKRSVGLVFQDFALFPHLSVEDNIGFRLRDRAPANRWIDQLGLETHRRAMPDTLSGGQKQRVALARALAHAPALLLLDEPLASLDATLKAQLRWDIRQALKSAAMPAIWVTHDQTEALSVGDRMAVMRDGRLEQVGQPDACFRRPASRFVARFLGDAAFVPGRLDGHSARTELGDVPVDQTVDAIGPIAHDDAVDVMMRPDDLSLSVSDNGSATVDWCRYEGETRLYGVRLDSGAELRVRTNHEDDFAEGTRVDMRVCAGHALTAYPAQAVSPTDA